MRTVSKEDNLKFLDILVLSLQNKGFCKILTASNPLLSEAVDLHNPRLPEQVAGDRIRIGFLQNSLVAAIALDESRRDTKNRMRSLCDRHLFRCAENLPGIVFREISADESNPARLASELCSAFHGV